jgi:hypothetical protein
VFVTIEDETGVANLIVWPKSSAARAAPIGVPLCADRIGRELTKLRKRIPTIIGVGCGHDRRGIMV